MQKFSIQTLKTEVGLLHSVIQIVIYPLQGKLPQHRGGKRELVRMETQLAWRMITMDPSPGAEVTLHPSIPKTLFSGPHGLLDVPQELKQILWRVAYT